MRFSVLGMLAVAAIACSPAPASGRGPVPADPPNGVGQRPAFAGQTRAPQPEALTAVRFETIAEGLEIPWGIAVLPDGRMLVTERPGKLRVIMPDGRVLDPVAGVPEVDARGQGGLLDVAARPEGEGLRVCLTYAEARGDGANGTAAACGHATGAENITLSDMRVIFRQEPPWRSTAHFGSRIVFGPGDTVFITTGERFKDEARVNAQRVDSTIGKVVRLRLDGTAPADNPFAAQGGVAAQVWSMGHRNVQAAALDASGALWTVEHGPRGGDELNKPQAGRNYGWPIITYGIDYDGRPIGQGITAHAGMEQPVYYWDPVIAPGGMTFYSGDLFPGWRGDLLIAGLGSRSITRLTLANDRVATEERIAMDARTRTLANGPGGAVIVVMEDGRILRMTPR